MTRLNDLRVTPWRFKTRKGKMVTEFLIERYESLLLGWEWLFHHGLVSFPTRAEALEYVRIYNAVRKFWKRRKKNVNIIPVRGES